MPATGEQRAEHVDRGTDPLDQLVGRDRHDVAGVRQFETPRRRAHHVDADRREQIAHDRDVGDVGHVGEVERAIGEQRRRHQLEHGVLRPGNGDRPGEWTVAPDEDRIVAARVIGGTGCAVGLLGRIHGPPVCSLREARRAHRQPPLARRPRTPSAARGTARRRRARTDRLTRRVRAGRRSVRCLPPHRRVRRWRTARDDAFRRDDPLVRLAVPLAGPRGARPQLFLPVVVGTAGPSGSDTTARARSARRGLDECGLRQHAVHPDRQLRR